MLQRIYAYSCMYLFKLVFSSSLNKFPEVKMLYHILVLFLIFWGNWILYSIVPAPVYIPSMQGFPFLHILTKIVIIFDCLIVVILTGMRWFLVMVLLCISLMTGDAVHLFMCLLIICISSFENDLFRSSAHFLIRLFSFLY